MLGVIGKNILNTVAVEAPLSSCPSEWGCWRRRPRGAASRGRWTPHRCCRRWGSTQTRTCRCSPPTCSPKSLAATCDLHTHACIEIWNYSTINLFKPQKETFAFSLPQISRGNGNTAISHLDAREIFSGKRYVINFLSRTEGDAGTPPHG